MQILFNILRLKSDELRIAAGNFARWGSHAQVLNWISITEDIRLLVYLLLSVWKSETQRVP